jgi:hypothetical protein
VSNRGDLESPFRSTALTKGRYISVMVVHEVNGDMRAAHRQTLTSGFPVKLETYYTATKQKLEQLRVEPKDSRSNLLMCLVVVVYNQQKTQGATTVAQAPIIMEKIDEFLQPKPELTLPQLTQLGFDQLGIYQRGVDKSNSCQLDFKTRMNELGAKLENLALVGNDVSIKLTGLAHVHQIGLWEIASEVYDRLHDFDSSVRPSLDQLQYAGSILDADSLARSQVI